MTEFVLDISALPSYLTKIFNTKKVRVREANRVITIIPSEEKNKIYRCPFLGIATDSNITVDGFLEWKNEERESEYENELCP